MPCEDRDTQGHTQGEGLVMTDENAVATNKDGHSSLEASKRQGRILSRVRGGGCADTLSSDFSASRITREYISVV